jgi:hypothetical protein
VIPPRFFLVLATVSLVFGVVQIMHMFRARAMRALAARWGFQYIGPPVPKWWNPAHTHISPPLPGWLSRGFRPAGRRLRQVWNVIEGQQNGVSVVIFDTIIGEMRDSGPCTLIACQTEQNPFGIVTPPDRLIQSHGWTVVHGVWLLHFSWAMGIRRLDKYLNRLRVDSRSRRLKNA